MCTASVTAGVIPRARVAAFETMLWRISRGNVFIRLANLQDPVQDPVTVGRDSCKAREAWAALSKEQTLLVVYFPALLPF